ncbi:nidogen-like [Paramacrobiotus metropolitanus]|uniref:nidogen-like n=1 Tax=Paramacrobiotus metropolitanus TaxID=2943436 RepID=UPI0024459391|nr:nidogen-like [Paramacrobiotus metropolitanus]
MAGELKSSMSNRRKASGLFTFGIVAGFLPSEKHLWSDGDNLVTFFPEHLNLTVPIILYGVPYHEAYVSLNGIVTLGPVCREQPRNPENPDTNVPLFNADQFPFKYPAIAPFYAHIDNENEGLIYFRESKRAELVARADELIHQSYPDQADTFRSQSVFLATWHEVLGYGNSADVDNSFQLALASNGQESYAIFLYPQAGIEWTQFSSQPTENVAQPRYLFAQAGYTDGKTGVTTLPGSGTDCMRDLPKNRYPESAPLGVYVYCISKVTSS